MATFKCSGVSKPSSFPTNVILNREYGFNKALTGNLVGYNFMGGNDYKYTGFGCYHTGFMDLWMLFVMKTDTINKVYFIEPIDLTRYSKIRIGVEWAAYGGSLAIGETTDILNNSTRSLQLNKKVDYATPTDFIEMDISDLSGKYYLGFIPSPMVGESYTTYLCACISSIVLVK